MVMSNWVTWPKKGREDKEQMKTKGAFHLSELTSRTSQAVNRMHHFEGMLLKSNHSENSTRQFEEIQVWSSKKKKKKKPSATSIHTNSQIFRFMKVSHVAGSHLDFFY